MNAGGSDPWSFACPDWFERLQQGRSLVPDLPLDRAEAERAVAIFNLLRLPDVHGQPAMAEAAGEWFRDIIRAIFGSLDPATGRRRVADFSLPILCIFAWIPVCCSRFECLSRIHSTPILSCLRSFST